MSTQNYFVLTAEQCITAHTFDSPDAAIGERAVDSASPGSGVNINDLATGFNVGDPITLVGKFVAPVRIVNDPAYLFYVPDMVTYLLTLPAALLENETIFLPPDL